MTRSRALLIVAAALCAACFHVTVITGAPSGTQTINKEWQNAFVFGIVPPDSMNTKERCPQGVAKVETERSFLNGLVGALTDAIYTPLHVQVTCATGPVAR